MHLRGCSREDGDAVFAPEDAKRPRAVSPSSAISSGDASRTLCTGSRARPVEKSSIYALTSPWLTVPAPKEARASLAASMEGGGAPRALCFGEGEEEGLQDDQVCKTVRKWPSGFEERCAWFREN